MRTWKLALFRLATFVQRQWFEQKLCLPSFAFPQARAPTIVSALAVFETHERSDCDMFSALTVIGTLRKCPATAVRDRRR